MLSRLTSRHIVVAALLVIAVAPAWGQADPGRPSYSRMLDIDALLENHARMLARRYNLNQEQDLYTQALLREKANAFLDKHREELFDLVDRMVEVKAGGDISAQELVAWGKQALPLYEEAKTLIIEGNSEWRQILNDDQRKTHDEDLQEMYTAFGTTEDQLQRIVSGQMTVDEFRRGPARQVTGPQPPMQPVRPMPPSASPQASGGPGHAPPPTAAPAGPRSGVSSPAGNAVARTTPGPARHGATRLRRGLSRRGPGTTANPASPQTTSASTDFESQWEAYVREFIQKYQLDDGQTERALSYLRDAQSAGRRVIARTKSEIEQLDKKLAELGESKDKDKLKELNEITARRTKLLEPINDIFEKQLKPRLERLPTQKERQAAEEAGKGTPGSNPAPAGRGGRPGLKPPPPPAEPQPLPPEQDTGP